MKAIITKIEKGDMAVDVSVTYSNNKGFTVDRVLVVSEEKFSNMNENALEDFIRSEGKRYVEAFKTTEALQSLVGREIKI